MGPALRPEGPDELRHNLPPHAADARRRLADQSNPITDAEWQFVTQSINDLKGLVHENITLVSETGIEDDVH